MDRVENQSLAEQEATVRELIQLADRVIRTVRPNHYSEYDQLRQQLRRFYVAYRNYCSWAASDFQRADLFMRDLADLRPEGLEGLIARDEARAAVGETWRLWWAIYNVFKEVARRYVVLQHIDQDPIAGATRPPADPPELV